METIKPDNPLKNKFGGLGNCAYICNTKTNNMKTTKYEIFFITGNVETVITIGLFSACILAMANQINAGNSHIIDYAIDDKGRKVDNEVVKGVITKVINNF